MTDLWHPDDNQCALFIEGALDEATTNEISRHLETCNDCIEMIGGAARTLRERAWWQQPAVWRAAAAVVIAVAGLAAFRLWHPTSGIDALAAAAPHEYRLVEPRLTGFAFAPFHTYRGPHTDTEADDPAYLRLEAAASKALDRATKDSSADAAHVAGVGYLVLRESDNAIRWLEKATRRNRNDAHAWNDLAAAQCASNDFQSALASVTRAIQLDPRLPEGQFNRALILERLGKREQALDAWRAYLRLDPNSGWAGDARDHIRRLSEWP